MFNVCQTKMVENREMEKEYPKYANQRKLG